MAQVNIIGSGFSSLAAAGLLAKEGHDVSIFEKNPTFGGRARQFQDKGFTFDMGPSWYWMPDVFERFFRQFNQQPSDYYQLVKLDPSFRIFFGKGDILDIPDSYSQLEEVFESLEVGSAKKLRSFLENAKQKYEVGMQHLVYKQGNSLWEFATWEVLRSLLKLDLFTSFDTYTRSHFRHEKLIALMEFPILFLGAMPSRTPALYSLMNYAGLRLGTWYPLGGMYEIVNGMTRLLQSLGVEFHAETEVQHISASGGRSTLLHTSKGAFKHDVLIAGADYHHVEQSLLPEKHRKYSPGYWNKRSLSPSCLLAFVGVKKRIKNLLHHNLFFHEDFQQHAQEIYVQPKWPTKPLFYVCCPSKTDDSIAPEGMENLFFLLPIAPNLEDSPEAREEYFHYMLSKIEQFTGEAFAADIIYRKLYCVEDFKMDYHALKGNAYGLSNTLQQTAILKPKMRSDKIGNLFYTGHLTVPGPGVPPALISGQIAAKQASQYLKNHESNL